MSARVQVRRSRYRGEVGWSIVGTDVVGRKIKVFTGSRVTADELARAYREGRNDDIDTILLAGVA